MSSYLISIFLIIITSLTFFNCNQKMYLVEQEYQNILKVISRYYPSKLSFGDDQYFLSDEYQRLKDLCDTNLNNDQIGRLTDELKTNFGQNKIRNYSLIHDANPSYSVRIELPSDKDSLNFIVINISIMMDYYCIYYSSTNLKSGRGFVDFDYNKFYSERHDLDSILKSFFPSFRQISSNLASRKVPNVSTRKRNIDYATVFDCLFSDHIW